MSAAPLALLSSVSWGAADFAGGTASRRGSSQAATAFAAATGLLLLLALTPFLGIHPDGRALAFGVAAGLGSSLALLAFYRALATGRMSVVAPVASTGVLVPIAVGLVQGDRPSVLQTVGLVAAVVGVVLACGPERHLSGGRPLLLAAVAAVGFGTVLTLLALGAAHDRGTTLLASRGTLTAVTAVVASRGVVTGDRRFLLLTVLAGCGDAGANILFVIANTSGELALVAVLGSLYPVVTVLLARAFHDERLAGVQLVGVVLTLAGVVGIARG